MSVSPASRLVPRRRFTPELLTVVLCFEAMAARVAAPHLVRDAAARVVGGLRRRPAGGSAGRTRPAHVEATRRTGADRGSIGMISSVPLARRFPTAKPLASAMAAGELP